MVAPSQSTAPVVAVHPGYVASVIAYSLESTTTSASALAVCGPGLYWAADGGAILGVLEARSYPVPEAFADLSGLQCPLSGGIVVASRNGEVRWAPNVDFEGWQRISTGLVAPQVALGPRDEMWIWQRDPGALVLLDGSSRLDVDPQGTIDALAAAAPRTAVVAVNRADGSTRLEVLDATGNESDESVVRTEIAALSTRVFGVAVASGGRLVVSTAACLRLFDGKTSGACIATVPPGVMASQGDEVAVLTDDGSQVVLVSLVSTESGG